MLRRLIVPALTTLLILGSFGSQALAAAEASTAPDGSTVPDGAAEALLEALARVPDSPEVRGAILSYLDQAALVAARPGAAQPVSVAEALASLETDDPSARLWLAAFMGAASGDMDLVSHLALAAGWPEQVGFDLLDVERHLTFGTPPSDGSVLLGDFDPSAVAAAFEARGYSSSQTDERTLLCGAAGCDEGMATDLASADRSLPFGAGIGRSEPLAVTAETILSSADLGTLEGMMAAEDGEAASLADDPAYRALAMAAAPGARLTQASFLPGGMLDIGPGIYVPLGASPEEAASLVTELSESLEPMPAAAAVAILDGATDDEQVVTIAMAYADEADAAIAAEVVPRRLEGMPAVSYEAPLSELLSERGVTSVSGSVEPAGEGTMAVARVEVRAPLPSAELDAATDRPSPSSGLYRLFADLVLRRDLLWLVPVLPLE